MKKHVASFVALWLSITVCPAAFAGEETPMNIELPGAAPYSAELVRKVHAAVAAKGAVYRPRTEHLRPDGSAIYTNRLIFEASPYLQQHAHNPVDWYAWGPAAFDRAAREGKPIFLSIGYSTCHWCHVMERECFENIEIARQLNEHFIAIKVDREERPDVDEVYMTAVQLATGGGGWPMSSFLTSDGKPFYGGTYFPPQQFTVLLERITEAWRDDRPHLTEAAGKLAAAVAEVAAARGKAQKLGSFISNARTPAILYVAKMVSSL